MDKLQPINFEVRRFMLKHGTLNALMVQVILPTR